MKAIFPAVVAAVSAASLVFAGDTPAPTATIVTLSGAKYEKAIVSTVTPDAITVTHSTEVARIPFVDLPAEIQRQYGYDPTNAAAYQAQLAEAQRAEAARLAPAAEQKKREERAKKLEYIKRRDAGEAAGERIKTLRLELPAIEEENRRAREDALKAVLKAKQQP